MADLLVVVIVLLAVLEIEFGSEVVAIDSLVVAFGLGLAVGD